MLFEKKFFADVFSSIKMSSYWISVGPNPMTGVLITRDTRTHSRDPHMMTEVEPVYRQGTLRTSSNHRGLGRDMGQILPQRLQREPTLPTP